MVETVVGTAVVGTVVVGTVVVVTLGQSEMKSEDK